MIRWRNNPKAFVTEAFRDAEASGWQGDALTAIAEQDRVAIRSGHGVGKSSLFAWVILWWLITRFPAKVACTAPTAHQLEDVLWGEVAKWHRRLKEPFRSWIEVKSDRVELKSAPNESFAVARTARKEQPEAFQGFHSENMLFLVDEASGVEDIIFEVGEGAMSTPGAKTLMAGNPTRTDGYFHSAFHKMAASWRKFKVSVLDCLASPFVSKTYAGEMERKYGIDSNIYRVRVQGDFPTSEDDAVIPLHLCEAAKERKVEPVVRYMPVWGLDVARSLTGDRTALAKRRANYQLEPVKSWRIPDTMQIAGRVAAEYYDTKQTKPDELPSEILVDVIGFGAGVLDRLRELGIPARGINVGESPAVNDGRYMRLRDELWWKTREWLAERDSKLCDDDDLISELTAPKYKFSSTGKILVESKDDMKKRTLDKRSPDLADAFMLTMAGGLSERDPHEIDRYRRRRPNQGSAWAA